MAVYIELMPMTGGNLGRGDGRSRRAGTSNVRRPFRGIEVKADTFAFFRVLRSDGTPLELVDSSAKTGQSSTYANFLLQSVQEQRMERQQILETFGAPLVFFFGEAPRFVNISAVVLDTNDFNWHAEWWENYHKYLRGTKLAERGSTALLHYDDTILEGYPTQCSASRSSDNRNMVQIQMQMFVTNYLNVSNIGDIMFPLREGSNFPDLVPRDANTYTFAVPVEDAAEQNRRALLAYLQRTAIQNIQNQILKARTIERARELQRQLALEELGVETRGADLISLGKSILQGAYRNVKDPTKTYENNQRVLDELGEQSRRALGLAKEGRIMEAIKLLKEGEVRAGLRGLGSAITQSPRPGSITLQEALRNALLYSAPSPAADLNGFLEKIRSLSVNGPGATQIMDTRRTLPYRSKIWDNYDEYTQRGEGEEAVNAFEARTGAFSYPKDSEVSDLKSSVSKVIENAGSKPTPQTMRSLGLMPWQPDRTRLPGEHTFGLNDLAKGANWLLDKTHQKGWRIPVSDDNNHTFHKQWGGTPDVGGSYGGSLGGAGGPGVAGMSPQPHNFFALGSGLPHTSPWGVPGQAPYAYTDGYGPTGEPLYQKSFSYGSKEGGSFLGGGVLMNDTEKKGSSQQGKGFFSMVVLETKP